MNEFEERVDEPDKEHEKGKQRELERLQIQPGAADDRLRIDHPKVDENHNPDADGCRTKGDPSHCEGFRRRFRS